MERRVECGHALVGPGFVDLDALSDLDTIVLAFDNQPAWRKGRVWLADYLHVAREMYTTEELAWQRKPYLWPPNMPITRLGIMPRLFISTRR